MKILIVEDDFLSRTLLQEFLNSYGPSYIAVNGKEAVEAARIALEAKEPYDVICMDIMMPEMDGQTALQEIRAMEGAMGVKPDKRSKILMTTALDDPKSVVASYRSQCDAYLVKPITRKKLTEELRKLKLIPL